MRHLPCVPQQAQSNVLFGQLGREIHRAYQILLREDEARLGIDQIIDEPLIAK